MLDFDQFAYLTFDCYGTLIDWERGIVEAFKPVLARHGVELSDDEILSDSGARIGRREAALFAVP